MELRQIWEIIWRRKWIIIQAFLVIFLTTIIGSFLLTPVYETSAKVLIKTPDTASSLLTSIGLEGIMPLLQKPKPGETETRMALATVEPVLEEVISRLQLRTKDGELMKPEELVESKFILSTLFPEPYVEIEPVEDTDDASDLFEIKTRSCDPEEAAMISNTLAEVYIEDDLRRRREDYGNARDFIDGQIKRVKADYLNALEEIKDFKLKEETVDLETETKSAVDKVAELMSKKEEIITNIYETQAKVNTLKTQLGKQNDMLVSGSTIAENPQIENLKKNLTELELQLTEGLTEKTQDHPDVIALKQKISKVREELRNEVDFFQESSQELQNLEREVAAQEAQLKSVKGDIDRHMSLLSGIPQKAFSESQLNLKLSASQDIYSSLLEYLYQVGVAEAMTFSDIRVVEPAVVPDIVDPESPNKVLNGIMGIFLGLMFGFGLGFLVDYLDDTIKTPEEVRMQGLTVLGTIPKFKRRERPLISDRDPRDPVYESYRTVRNSLKFISSDKPLKSLLITSSIEGEGKTTTLANLGVSIAREGKEVLLIDADLRKPQIHELVGVTNSTGITTILADLARPGEVIKKTDIEGLSVLTSGPIPPDPGQLIESQKMQQLIKELGQKYNFIILDSPPILIANDAIILAGCVDGSVIVLESGKITRRALSQARELLNQTTIQPIGAILNKFKTERGGYYYYKGGYYGGKKK